MRGRQAGTSLKTRTIVPSPDLEPFALLAFRVSREFLSLTKALPALSRQKMIDSDDTKCPVPEVISFRTRRAFSGFVFRVSWHGSLPAGRSIAVVQLPKSESAQPVGPSVLMLLRTNHGDGLSTIDQRLTERKISEIFPALSHPRKLGPTDRNPSRAKRQLPLSSG